MAAVGAYSLHCCKMEVTLSIIDKLDPTVQLVAEIAVNCSVFLFFFFFEKDIPASASSDAYGFFYYI